MVDKSYCEFCGCPLIHKIEGSTQGLFCTSCGKWGAVTSYIPLVETDETLYHLYLTNGDPRNINHIRAISKISTKNFKESKELLNTSNAEIYSGVATDVKVVVDELEQARLKYLIQPLFPH